MNRRDINAVSGYVNFPIDKFESSSEGGMFVRLVVVPTLDGDEEFMQCCGGYCTVQFDETLMDDDETVKLPIPEYPGDDADLDELQEWIKADDSRREACTKFHFPYFGILDGGDAYQSIPYLATMVIGSTGWSSGEWVCTYDDLTDAGKELYNSIKNLYNKQGRILLQTWLDT